MPATLKRRVRAEQGALVPTRKHTIKYVTEGGTERNKVMLRIYAF